MTSIPFVRDMDFNYGECDTLSPLIRRVIANNPSPFTFTGTGTYIIGTGEVAVIDPGPHLPAHIDAICNALGAHEKITHIFITHTHLDHSPAAAPLAARTDAKVYGRPLNMKTDSSLEGSSEAAALLEEDVDDDFKPDHIVQDGEVFSHADWTLEALHTPGHLANHICYALPDEKVLFTGDHVMGWATSVIVPPDGNMRAYMQSLDLLLHRDDVRYWPTHGPAIENPQDFVRAYIAHRQNREAQILERLQAGDTHIPAMVKVLYTHVDTRLHGAAALSVLAHIEDLKERGLVVCEGAPTLNGEYALSQ